MTETGMVAVFCCISKVIINHDKILVKGPSDLELLFVSVVHGPTIGVFYRPPSSPAIVMDTLFNVLSSFDIHIFSNLVLIGDFNIDFYAHPIICIIIYPKFLTASPSHKSTLPPPTVRIMAIGL